MDDDQSGRSRRAVLQGVALAGIGACAAGCAARPARPAGPVDLGAAGQVPVGGAKLFREDRVVVAQPGAGTFKAFSAVCTHQGCVVASLRHGILDCPCHGSEFHALTGAVVRGPATRPLPEVPVTVSGGKLVVRL